MTEIAVLDKAVTVLQHGGLIAYPTEAVYGIGCDPYQAPAVLRLSTLKERARKGYIILVADWAQIYALIDTQYDYLWPTIQASWPGPWTWIFVANARAPAMVCAADGTIALRMSKHPTVVALLKHFGRPLISTSANYRGEKPLLHDYEVQKQLGADIDWVVSGSVGGALNPTTICDARTGKVIRAS